MSFNPYAAGAKRYQGSSAPNIGQTLDPSGYMERSRTQQAAKRMQQQQGFLPPSQKRSGLAANALKRSDAMTQQAQTGQHQMPGGQMMSDSQMSPASSGQTGTTIPAQTVIREPNPTWDISSVLSGLGAAQPQLPETNFGGAPAMQPAQQSFDPNQEWWTGPALMPEPLQPAPEQDWGWGGPAPIPGGITPAPVTPPVTPPVIPQEAPETVWGNVLQAIQASAPNWSPAAPSVNMPKLPTFKGGSQSLEADLRAQRGQGYTGLNETISQIANALRDAENEYLTENQQQQQAAQKLFRTLGDDYASRGVAGSSAYGQDYISNTQDVTQQRNELDQWLGRGQRDLLSERTSAVQAYQNLLDMLNATQGGRTAAKKVGQKLGSASGGTGGSGASLSARRPTSTKPAVAGVGTANPSGYQPIGTVTNPYRYKEYPTR